MSIIISSMVRVRVLGPPADEREDQLNHKLDVV